MKFKNEKLKIDGEYKPLPKLKNPPRKSVMNLEAVVDPTPQKLRRIRPYVLSQHQVPKDIPAEAQVVLHNILSCFDRQKSIQEGLIGDLMWGFAQCGIPENCTAVGLKELEKLGYVKFQAPDNTYVKMSDDAASKAWVRYQPKILDIACMSENTDEHSASK